MEDCKQSLQSEKLINLNGSEGLATEGSITYIYKYLLTIVNNLKIEDSPDSKSFVEAVNWAIRRKHLQYHKIMYEIQPSTNKIHCHVIIDVINEKAKYTLQRAVARKFGKGYRIHFQKIKDAHHLEACKNYQKFFKAKLNLFNSNQIVLETYDKIRKAKQGHCPYHAACTDFTKNECNAYVTKLKKDITVTFW